MTYLVTGGTGFIGSRIVRDLVRQGEDVVIYDWAPATDGLERLLDKQEIEQHVKLVAGDVTDFPFLVRTLKDNNVESVVHLAALMYLDVNANPLRGIRVNCEGTVNVFEAARLLGLKKVVWESSGSVFGPPEKYAEEYIPNDAPHYPQNLYGAAKSFDENAAAYYTDRYRVDITALRLVMVYGAGQKRGRNARIIRELVANPAIGIPGNVPAAADNLLGWMYVDDAARATVMACQVANPPTRAYSVRGDICTIGEIAEYVKRLAPGADITLLPPEKSGASTIMTCKYDMTPFETEIGYRPQWTIRDGLRETMNIVRTENGLPPLA
ncbi:MAG: NAD(P)-dependent oxidoreductase [Dehalococcoidales bacterium]|nr:NAD(P)-dependent oxidoreductase [Dehalococcoidales bacterium]